MIDTFIKMKRPDIDEVVTVNGIKIHYVIFENKKKPNLLCLHGLTANAFAFQGLIEAGLSDHFNVISIDQRGRGKSSAPAFGYSIREHGKDVIALLDHLQLDTVQICGHSFGGLMACYLAYTYPARFSKVFILDAAPKMNPKAPEMLMPALGRLDKKYKNFYDYLETVKAAEYMLFWDEAMLAYYQADVSTQENDTVESIPDIAQIIQISTAVSLEPWAVYFKEMKHTSYLVVGTDNYTLNEPLLPTELARDISDKMKDNHYVEVAGNHHTMLYRFGAEQIVGVLSASAN
jgi:pimeloyl-ACP methyl ester carboxylesterase